MGSSKEGFKFPDCWSNDVRMVALFAPFRSKSVNPTDWNSKMKFWMNLIESWCKFNKNPIIEISSLKKDFSRKGSTPVCIDDVLLNMRSAGIIISKDDFMASNESWKAWAVKVLVTNPLKWTFNTVKGAIVKQNDTKEIYYIHLPVLKFLGEDLAKNFASQKGKLTNSKDLMQMGFKDSESLSLVMHWLHKQGIIDIYNENELTLIKFSKNNKNGVKITETDIGIYSLEKQQNLLEENIKKLENDRISALEEAKRHLSNKMKNMAKISLRKKGTIEKTIEKRTVMLENIQGILHKIDQAKLDSEVIDCYQKGIATMKEIFKSTGLNEGTVVEVMNELKDVLSTGNDIEEAMAQPMDVSLDQSLEDELNELLLKEAPDVPVGDLSTPEKKTPNTSKENEELPIQMQALSI